MTFIDDEIARQPESWRICAELVRTRAAGISGLPTAGERVAVVGCGTSWFMAEAYAQLRESQGLGITEAHAASEFPPARNYDRIVAISRSGTTTEILELLAGERGRTPSVVLTADPRTPVIELADDAIVLDFADERSVVQTLFATSALTLLRAHLGQDVESLAQAAELAIVEPLPGTWSEVEQITFLGRGWTHGIAREAALKMREACQLWTEAYPAMEYRHGPIAIAAAGRLVWYFGAGAEELRDEVAATGATFVHSADDPQVDLIRVQRLAAAMAVERGLDPDNPQALTRSVVLASVS